MRKIKKCVLRMVFFVVLLVGFGSNASAKTYQVCSFSPGWTDAMHMAKHMDVFTTRGKTCICNDGIPICMKKPCDVTNPRTFALLSISHGKNWITNKKKCRCFNGQLVCKELVQKAKGCYYTPGNKKKMVLTNHGTIFVTKGKQCVCNNGAKRCVPLASKSKAKKCHRDTKKLVFFPAVSHGKAISHLGKSCICFDGKLVCK